MTQGVVVHVNDGNVDKQRSALRQTANLREEMPDIPISLVLQADAVTVAVEKDTPLAKEIIELQSRGVRIAVCRRTLKAKQIDEQSLMPYVQIVSSAMSELVLLQDAGYRYIKP